MKISRQILFCLYVLFFRSLCAGSDAPYTGDDERNAQYLSHIHRQTCLECYLNLLGIFDEETEGEDKGKAKTEIETGAYALRSSLLVDEEDEEEKAEVCQSLVELTRMAWILVFANEDKCPRHIGNLADNL